MGTKRFLVTFSVEVAIEIDQSVIDEVLTEDWRGTFYPLHTPEDVAGHLAFNFAHNKATLAVLDGFADMDEAKVKMHSEDWEPEGVEEQSD